MKTISTKNHKRQKEHRNTSHPAKITALLYIREALAAERYEEMKEMIAIAEEFGATLRELESALLPLPFKKEAL